MFSEEEWGRFNHPEALVSWVFSRWGGKAQRQERYDPERLRLFACACLRRVWDLLDDEHRRAVELLEEHVRSPRPGGLVRTRQAYRQASRRLAQEWVERWDSQWDAGAVIRALEKSSAYTHFGWHILTAIAGPRKLDLVNRLDITARCRAASAVWRASANKPSAAALACSNASEAAGYRDALERARRGGRISRNHSFRSAAESSAQADLFRDIYRNPSAPNAVAKSCLAWRDGTVVKLARGIDRDQDWSRLPILADALEEAGCDDAGLVAHCRSAGPHVPGCWAVDLVLGRGCD
jgi:hypothetical protein